MLPYLSYQNAQGKRVDQVLFEHSKAHSNGLYPIPDLASNEVVTTIVNVGESNARLLGHLAWETGEHSMGPFVLPPGGGKQIRFNQLAEAQKRDLLSRSVGQSFEQGFFQWTSNRGSQALIARTEVTPQGSSDRYGFSCYGCCLEMPSGGVSPSGGVVFDIGQTPSFEGTEFIHTCTGTTGPYYVGVPSTMYYQSPIGWTGTQLSATGLAEQTVGFQETGTYMWTTCVERTRTFSGGGPINVDKCHRDNADGLDETQGCFQPANSSSCGDCYSCCDKIRAAANCRCKGNQICKNGVQSACGTCKQRCFGQYNVDCDQQIVSCN